MLESEFGQFVLKPREVSENEYKLLKKIGPKLYTTKIIDRFFIDKPLNLPKPSSPKSECPIHVSIQSPGIATAPKYDLNRCRCQFRGSNRICSS